MRPIDADAIEIPMMQSELDEQWMKIAIKAAPTIEAEPVQHGRWIPYDADCRGFATQFLCTKCKTYSYTHTYQKGCDFEYCPNCGAKMDGGAEMAEMKIHNDMTADGEKLSEVIERGLRMRWIPCSERLPELLQNVIICFEIRTVTIGWINGDGWQIYDSNWKFGFDEVTHWMPLPGPPEGGADDADM